MIEIVEQRRAEIESLCRRLAVKRLDLFGSATSDQFDFAQSDLDFLVDFHKSAMKDSAKRYFELLHGLEDIFHRSVDLVDLPAVRNRFFLEHLSRTAELLYAA